VKFTIPLGCLLCASPSFADSFAVRAKCSYLPGILAGNHCVQITAEEEGWRPPLIDVDLTASQGGSITGEWQDKATGRSGKTVLCNVKVNKHLESDNEISVTAKVSTASETNSFQVTLTYPEKPFARVASTVKFGDSCDKGRIILESTEY